TVPVPGDPLGGFTAAPVMVVSNLTPWAAEGAAARSMAGATAMRARGNVTRAWGGFRMRRLRYLSGGVLAGGRRCRVACSYAYASLMSVPYDHARPKNVMPAGSVPRVYPIGTWMAGNPVVG